MQLLLVIALIVIVLGGATPMGTIYAQGIGDSCYTRYERFTDESWRELDTCIRDTNDRSAGERLVIRTGCNARWVSNALEAASRYSTCMAFKGLGIGK